MRAVAAVLVKQELMQLAVKVGVVVEENQVVFQDLH